MYLEIVSPEATLFSQEIEAVSVPGILGEFQILNLHANIVSVLGKGNVKIQGQNIVIDEKHEDQFSKENNKYLLAINSGTIELNNNKLIVLVD